MTNSNSKSPDSRGDRRKSLLRRRLKRRPRLGSDDLPADDARPEGTVEEPAAVVL